MLHHELDFFPCHKKSNSLSWHIIGFILTIIYTVKFYSILLTYTILVLNIISCNGQNTDDLIKNQQEKLNEQQNQVEDILVEIEDLKLLKIQETLKKYITKPQQ